MKFDEYEEDDEDEQAIPDSDNEEYQKSGKRLLMDFNY